MVLPISQQQEGEVYKHFPSRGISVLTDRSMKIDRQEEGQSGRPGQSAKNDRDEKKRWFNFPLAAES